MHELIASLKNGLIVSCQTDGDGPLDPSSMRAAYAVAAEEGGAIAVRIGGADHITVVRRSTDLPIIGFTEGTFTDGWTCITPEMKDIEALITAGADIIALDATPRRRPNGIDGIEFFESVRSNYDLPLIADIATFEEGIRAAEMGADALATTLAGFTEYTRHASEQEPDLQLIEELARAVQIPVIAQGRIWTPQQAKDALDRGAFAVVAGSAITRPKVITRRFVDAMAGIRS